MEQESLSSHENSGKACHLATSRSLIASSERGLIEEFQRLHEEMSAKHHKEEEEEEEEKICFSNLCYHFTDGTSEVQRGAVACPESHSKSMAKLGLASSEECLNLKE